MVGGDRFLGLLLDVLGAGQSGKPWPKLTAPYLTASRLISRMTDSVKDKAF
jgi:hypothetical protein